MLCQFPFLTRQGRQDRSTYRNVGHPVRGLDSCSCNLCSCTMVEKANYRAVTGYSFSRALREVFDTVTLCMSACTYTVRAYIRFFSPFWPGDVDDGHRKLRACTPHFNVPRHPSAPGTFLATSPPYFRRRRSLHSLAPNIRAA